MFFGSSLTSVKAARYPGDSRTKSNENCARRSPRPPAVPQKAPQKKLKENYERFRCKASKASQVLMPIMKLDKMEPEELPVFISDP